MTAPQQFLIYQSEDGSTRIDVMLEAESLWLNQKQLTELFGKAKGTITIHNNTPKDYTFVATTRFLTPEGVQTLQEVLAA